MTTETPTRSEHDDQPFPWRLTMVLGLFAAAGLVAAIYRFINGIGSIPITESGYLLGIFKGLPTFSKVVTVYTNNYGEILTNSLPASSQDLLSETKSPLKISSVHILSSICLWRKEI